MKARAQHNLLSKGSSSLLGLEASSSGCKSRKAYGEHRRTRRPFTCGRSGVPVAASSEVSHSNEHKDPFRAAAHRLHSLLNGVGDGTEELTENMLGEESSESKVILACLSGTIVSGAATLICWLIHRDPLGGATGSLESLQHAMQGAAIALPAAVIKYTGWSEEVHRRVPILEDIHEVEASRMRPLLTGITPQQAAVVSCAEITSSILLLFPAFEGCLQLSLQAYANRLQDLGWEVPAGTSEALALVLMASLCALGRVIDHAPSEEEFEIVGDAVSNADRYYKLVSTSVSQRQEEADLMSSAFKITAAAWVAQRTSSGAMSAAFSFAEILFLGALWHWTADLSSPLAAAFLIYGSDFAGMFERMQQCKPTKRQ